MKPTESKSSSAAPAAPPKLSPPKLSLDDDTLILTIDPDLKPNELEHIKGFDLYGTFNHPKDGQMPVFHMQYLHMDTRKIGLWELKLRNKVKDGPDCLIVPGDYRIIISTQNGTVFTHGDPSEISFTLNQAQADLFYSKKKESRLAATAAMEPVAPPPASSKPSPESIPLAQAPTNMIGSASMGIVILHSETTEEKTPPPDDPKAVLEELKEQRSYLHGLNSGITSALKSFERCRRTLHQSAHSALTSAEKLFNAFKSDVVQVLDGFNTKLAEERAARVVSEAKFEKLITASGIVMATTTDAATQVLAELEVVKDLPRQLSEALQKRDAALLAELDKVLREHDRQVSEATAALDGLNKLPELVATQVADALKVQCTNMQSALDGRIGAFEAKLAESMAQAAAQMQPASTATPVCLHSPPAPQAPSATADEIAQIVVDAIKALPAPPVTIVHQQLPQALVTLPQLPPALPIPTPPAPVQQTIETCPSYGTWIVMGGMAIILAFVVYRCYLSSLG